MNKSINIILRVILIILLFGCTPEEFKMNEFSYVFVTWSPLTINAGGEVDIADGSRGVKSRTWTFPAEAGVQFLNNSGNNNSSTEQIVYAVFPNPGIFDVRLQSTFIDPSIKLDTLIRVTVIDNVKALFTSDTREIRVGETVNFKSISTGQPNLYNWTFIGGTPESSNVAEPSVQYNYPGTWGVQLIAFRNSPLSRDTILIKDYIKVLPTESK